MICEMDNAKIKYHTHNIVPTHILLVRLSLNNLLIRRWVLIEIVRK